MTVESPAGGLIQTIRFDYNTVGMITNKVISGLAAGSSSYVYDSLDRLIEERREGGTPMRYRYDLAGNRTAVIRDGVTNAYTLGVGNRLISWGAQGAAQYDAAGNTTNLVLNDGPAVAMNWDAQYRLADAETASNIVRYAYDAMGRRAARIAVNKTSGETNTEYYVYKNNHIVADVDESGNMMRSYVWGPGVDNLLSMTVYNGETNTYYALKDHQNSVLAMTDADGHIVESYRYDAWGAVSIYDSSNQRIDKSLISNRYLWQGREYDFDTGLYNFRARWYCAETGRWLSKDPIGISGGLNQYVFCGNNPVNFRDPLGLSPGCIIVIGIVGIIAIAVISDKIGDFIDKYSKPQDVIDDVDSAVEHYENVRKSLPELYEDVEDLYEDNVDTWIPIPLPPALYKNPDKPE